MAPLTRLTLPQPWRGLLSTAKHTNYCHNNRNNNYSQQLRWKVTVFSTESVLTNTVQTVITNSRKIATQSTHLHKLCWKIQSSKSLSRNSSNLPSGLAHTNWGAFSSLRPYLSKLVTVNAPKIFRLPRLHNSDTSPTLRHSICSPLHYSNLHVPSLLSSFHRLRDRNRDRNWRGQQA